MGAIYLLYCTYHYTTTILRNFCNNMRLLCPRCKRGRYRESTGNGLYFTHICRRCLEWYHFNSYGLDHLRHPYPHHQTPTDSSPEENWPTHSVCNGFAVSNLLRPISSFISVAHAAMEKVYWWTTGQLLPALSHSITNEHLPEQDQQTCLSDCYARKCVYWSGCSNPCILAIP